MSRAILVAFWLLSAVGAVGAAFVLGYFGWAAMVLWTIVVAPCVLLQRRRMMRRWPTPLMVQFWVLTIGLNVAGGILPSLLSVFTFPHGLGDIIGWVLVAVIWSGLVASVVLLGWVTTTAVRGTIRQPSAA